MSRHRGRLRAVATYLILRARALSERMAALPGRICRITTAEASLSLRHTPPTTSIRTARPLRPRVPRNAGALTSQAGSRVRWRNLTRPGLHRQRNRRSQAGWRTLHALRHREVVPTLHHVSVHLYPLSQRLVGRVRRRKARPLALHCLSVQTPAILDHLLAAQGQSRLRSGASRRVCRVGLQAC